MNMEIWMQKSPQSAERLEELEDLSSVVWQKMNVNILREVVTVTW